MIEFNGEKLKIRVNFYPTNGHMGIVLFDKEGLPWDTITRNLVDTDVLGPCCHLDFNNSKDICEKLIEIGLLTLTGREDVSGHCSYPVAILNSKKYLELTMGDEAYEQN